MLFYHTQDEVALLSTPAYPKRPFRWRIALLLIIFQTVTTPWMYGHSPVPEARKGVLDLRQVNFNESVYVNLNGEWLFLPGDLEAHLPSQGNLRYIHVPMRWEKDPNLKGLTCGTYYLKVLLPQRPSDWIWAVFVPDAYSSSRLWVNGKQLSVSGSPSCYEQKEIRRFVNQLSSFIRTTDTTYITLEVSNHGHSKSGIGEALRLGWYPPMVRGHQNVGLMKWLLFGAVIMGALFFMGLYLFGKNEKPLMWLSVFCFAYAYRIVGSADYFLHDVLPNYPWDVAIKVEYLTLCISVFSFSRYTRTLFPQESPKVLNLVEWISLGYGIVCLLFPAQFFTSLITPYLLVLSTGVLTGMWVFFQAAGHRQPGSSFASMSAIPLLIGVGHSILAYLDVIHPFPALEITCYFFFFFFQSLIHSFRFAYNLNVARERAEMGARAKSEFLSTISHEIRTPLNAVIGFAHLLNDEHPRNDQKPHLRSLMFSAENLLSLINDLLDLSKLEAGKIELRQEPVNVKTLFERPVKMLANQASQKSLYLKTDFDPDLDFWVLADPLRLSQVMINLIGNAIKFTRTGGVTVGVKRQSLTDEFVELEISVSDTGIGISKEKQATIFDRFTQAEGNDTRQFSGTGLGLAIVKDVLGLMKSSIRLKSEAGKGSRFWFLIRVPLTTAPVVVAKTEVITANEIDVLKAARVLVVEDNLVNLSIAERFLKKWGLEVEKAMNGKEALELCKERTYDVILMDLHMPVMGGIEASGLIRALGIDTPILALTATLIDEVRDELTAAGMNDSIPKPFHPEQFRDTLVFWLRKSQEASLIRQP